MDSNKIICICEEYGVQIQARSIAFADGVSIIPRRLGAEWARAPMAEIPRIEVVAHLLFMTEEIPRLLDAGRVAKAMRWFGWLQGALWATSFETLHGAKMRNAPEGVAYDVEA